MRRGWLRASLALWRARARVRKLLHTRAQADVEAARVADLHPRQHLVDRRDVRSRQLAEARAMVARRKTQLYGPRVFRHELAGIAPPTRSFGELGPLRAVTVHHAAGPRAQTRAQAVRLNRQYDQAHRAKGWGGLGYHETIDDEGNLYVSPRATDRLTGAHVGGQNTGNYGLLVHGNYDTDEPTKAALDTLRWRLRHGHEHGLMDLRGVPVKGHCDWPPPGGSTACPGRHLRSKLNDL